MTSLADVGASLVRRGRFNKEKIVIFRVAHSFAVGITLVTAACATANFPSEAQPMPAKALHERLSGKAFVGYSMGMGWETRHHEDGRFQMRLTNGESDQGRWRTEDSRVCWEFEGKFPSGCSEVRADARQLYLKRVSTGEIVVMKPRQ